MCLTEAKRAALKWLRDRNGTGVFDRDGVLLAGGELGPFMRSTWNKLRDEGFLVIEKKRVTLLPAAYAVDVGRVDDRMSVEETRAERGS